jgi:putative ABC transport system permease protein
MLMIYAFFLIGSFLIGGVGLLGLTTTMSLNVLERRRELGAMRAVGATPRVIVMVVVGEALALGLISWILATALARSVTQALNNVLGTVFFRSAITSRFEPAAVVIWLIAAIALSALAAAIPAWNASRQSVREAVAVE